MSTQQFAPWDFWEHRALQCGVPPRLAAMGRQVMAEWYEKNKDDSTLGEETDGEFMIDICLDQPDEAEQRFREALEIGPEA